MDAWLTRLLAPKPARHGTMIWWQGENAAAELCEALKERNIAHALAFGQGNEPMAALTDALVAAGLHVEWVQGKTPQARGDRTAILTDGAGYPQLQLGGKPCAVKRSETRRSFSLSAKRTRRKRTSPTRPKERFLMR